MVNLSPTDRLPPWTDHKIETFEADGPVGEVIQWILASAGVTGVVVTGEGLTTNVVLSGGGSVHDLIERASMGASLAVVITQETVKLVKTLPQQAYRVGAGDGSGSILGAVSAAERPFGAGFVESIVLDLEFRRVRESKGETYGIGASGGVSGSGRVRASSGEGGSVDLGTDLGLEFSGTWDKTQGLSEIIRRTILQMVPGEDAEARTGVLVPVPRRTVSDAGTVSTNGFDLVEAGSFVKARATLTDYGDVVLGVSVEASTIVGQVEGVPTKDGTTFRTRVAGKLGERIFLGTLVGRDVDKAVAGWLGGRHSDTDAWSRVDVWATVTVVYSRLEGRP